MCAPIEGRSGPVGAQPRRGHCSKRWLAQCGMTGSTIHDRLIARIARELCIGGTRGILVHLSFPEPCGHPGFQPSPKHTLEGRLLPTQSITAVPLNTAEPSAVAIAPDADLDARWAAWRTRGVAHERAVRRKLTRFAAVAGSVAAAVAIAYSLLRP